MALLSSPMAFDICSLLFSRNLGNGYLWTAWWQKEYRSWIEEAEGEGEETSLFFSFFYFLETWFYIIGWSKNEIGTATKYVTIRAGTFVCHSTPHYRLTAYINRPDQFGHSLVGIGFRVEIFIGTTAGPFLAWWINRPPFLKSQHIEHKQAIILLMARATPEFLAHGLSLHLHTNLKKWKAKRNASDARYVVIPDVNLIRPTVALPPANYPNNQKKGGIPDYHHSGAGPCLLECRIQMAIDIWLPGYLKDMTRRPENGHPFQTRLIIRFWSGSSQEYTWMPVYLTDVYKYYTPDPN